MMIGSAELFLRIYQNRPLVLDYFFKYTTHLGDGIFQTAAVLIIFLGKDRRMALMQVIAFITGGLTSLALKNWVFTDSLRPFAYFRDKQGLILQAIEGVKMYSYNSMPSGHTITGFAVWGLIANMSDKAAWQIFCFSMAAITGFSRIYVGQHFPADVWAGSVIGTLAALCGYYAVHSTRLSKWV